jgi:formylglycine-generating enzyme required for sulfatase activity
MQGNVWEWCQDLYSDVYYQFEPDADPQGPAQAPFRVFRGGGWSNGPRSCRPADRFRDAPVNRYTDLGFRVAAVQE